MKPIRCRLPRVRLSPPAVTLATVYVSLGRGDHTAVLLIDATDAEMTRSILDSDDAPNPAGNAPGLHVELYCAECGTDSLMGLGQSRGRAELFMAAPADQLQAA